VLAIACCAPAQQAAVSAPPAAQQTAPENSGAPPLPDAPSASQTKSPDKLNDLTLADPFVPLTAKQKLHLWVIRTYSPYTFSSALLSATWDQITGVWPSYGGGMQGFGKRFGANLAGTEASGFFKTFLIPTLMHEDPRYFAKRTGGLLPRAWYAATRVLVTRNDHGDSTVNAAELLGNLFVRSLANAYIPQRDRGFGQTFNGTTGAVLSDAESNVLREFAPDLRRLFRKHEPEKVKKLEKKLPPSLQRLSHTQDDENQTSPPQNGPANK
jgi:hypothetical protein